MSETDTANIIPLRIPANIVKDAYRPTSVEQCLMVAYQEALNAAGKGATATEIKNEFLCWFDEEIGLLARD